MLPRKETIRCAVVLSIAVMGACATDPDCGEGRYKKGNGCYLLDSGDESDSGDDRLPDASTSEAAVSLADGARSSGDGSSGMAGDARLMDSNAAADSSIPPEGGGDGYTDASLSAPSTDAGPDAAPPPECDATHACASGLVCANAKCVSACMQTQCDPNASCSIANNAPTCTCNRGYTALSGSGTTVVCMRNLACDQLGCDAKATCEGSPESGFRCVCATGYTGSGKVCTPVACGAPPIAANVTWSIADGITFGMTTEGRCNAGYEAATATLLCGADKQWIGTPPVCKPRDCGEPESPKLVDGTVSGTFQLTGGTAYGAKATYSCKPPFLPSNETERVCQSNGRWSGDVIKCIGCGDHETLGSEPCDPSDPLWGYWRCQTGCQLDPQTIYRRCLDSSECSVAQGQGCASGVCSVACANNNHANCPATASGSGTSRYCADIGFCFATCSSTAECAPGLVCAAQGAVNVCVGCIKDNPTFACPSGRKCEMYPGLSYGYCR